MKSSLAYATLAAVVVLLGGGLFGLVVLLKSPPNASAEANSTPALHSGDQNEIDTAIDVARQYLRQQQPGRAETILAAAIQKAPNRQDLLLVMAETLLTLERIDDAYELYDRAISVGPDHAEYRHVAGMVAEQAGLLDEAELHLRAGQKLDSRNPKFPLFLGQVLRKMGKNDEARVTLVRATQLAPDLAIGWASLASIAIDENRLHVAEQYIDRACAIEPERTDWRVIKAMILRKQNRPREAADLLYALDERERMSRVDVVRELAMSLGLLGQKAEAASLVEQAALVNPENAEMAFEAAVWLERTGSTTRAAQYADRAARLGHEEAKLLLERLDP